MLSVVALIPVSREVIMINQVLKATAIHFLFTMHILTYINIKKTIMEKKITNTFKEPGLNNNFLILPLLAKSFEVNVIKQFQFVPNRLCCPNKLE